MAGDRPRLPAY